jgi:hypothetical protein
MTEQPAIPSRAEAHFFIAARKRRVVLCLLLLLVTLGFYNSVVRNRFTTLDDEVYILHNPHVRAGVSWSTFRYAFTTFDAGNWHPLTWLSHALDCQLFGLNPVGHHYINLLLHASNAVLLFLLLEGATGLTWPSLMVAALFALHPVNVESVAWAAERKNVLSMTFFSCHARLRTVRAAGQREKIRGCRGAIRPGIDGQAGDHHAALRIVALGLLAVAKNGWASAFGTFD